MIKEKLYIRLRELRKQHKLSQNEVADYLQLSRQSISQWETGKAYPDIDNIILLCKLYGISADEFLNVSGKLTVEEQYEQEKDEKVEETAIICNEEKDEEKDIEVQEEPQWVKDMKSSFDVLVVAIILALASLLPVLGIIIPIAIMIWIQKSGKKKKAVYVICVLGLLIGTYNTCAILNHYFMPDAGTLIIEKI